MNEEILVVTTFNQQGYQTYGERFIATFTQFWPQNYQLWVYAEDLCITPTNAQIKIFNLTESAPNLITFKQYWANRKETQGYLTGEDYNYNYDAIRFSHKVFAYLAAAQATTKRYMVWLDADTVTLKNIPADLIQSMLQPDYFLAYLGRIGYHSETGFIAFDLQNSMASEFLGTMQNFYLSGEIFKLLQWSDSFVFDTVRSVMAAQGKIKTNNLSANFNAMHPFVNSILGEYMDHLKGPKRKVDGKSFADDYIKV